MAFADTCPNQSLLYRHLACLYDPLFKRALCGRIRQAIDQLNIPLGSSVLDVGIGTGHYLAAYPPHARVTGIDLSEAMLGIAADEIQRRGWNHIELRQMDALHLQFAANSFDFVTAFHTASVVDDPQRLIHEMLRVCKPGGKLVIINHFRTENRWLSPWLDLLSSMTQWLGWRTNMSYQHLFDRSSIQVEKRYKTSPLSLFTVVIARKPTHAKPPLRTTRMRQENGWGWRSSHGQLHP